MKIKDLITVKAVKEEFTKRECEMYWNNILGDLITIYTLVLIGLTILINPIVIVTSILIVLGLISYTMLRRKFKKEIHNLYLDAYINTMERNDPNLKEFVESFEEFLEDTN